MSTTQDVVVILPDQEAETEYALVDQTLAMIAAEASGDMMLAFKLHEGLEIARRRLKEASQ